MTDQNSQFFAILTAIGKAKQANADALGTPWTFAQLGVGDANGIDPIPSEQQTQLINERRRAPLNQVKVDPNNANIIIAEQVIPENVGGWWIREIGLYDADGDLVAVANCAPSFKPLLSQGSGRTQVIRMNLIVSNTANIDLKIDPSVVLATRAYVDGKVLEEINKLDSKQSVRAATTANIALAGLQTVDGIALVAGDRVLVKNQAAAKDNGLYVAAAGAWARTTDADSNAEVTSAMLVAVEQGATLADTRWQLITDGAIVLGTTALTFQNVTQGFAPIISPALINPTGNTPAQFDSSLLLPTTEFVQRSLGSKAGVRIVDASLALTAAEAGFVILANISASNGVITLPAFSTVRPGVSFYIQCGAATNAISVKAPAGMTFGAPLVGADPSSVTIQPGSAIEFIYLSAATILATNGAGVAQLASFGFQKMSSGQIRQWGLGTANSSGTALVTFPIQFPNACLRVLTTPRNNAAYNATASVGISTAQNVTVYTTLSPSGQAGVAQALSFEWEAIGY
ncbi:Phage tail fiber protein [Pseudomonas chlororaphis subsp. aureofaciens]|uniref:phage tail protein n=1 Tax=Pseudomonas chlororaphis TaxID=587753 RepID=UPI000F58E30B|nr:phage tail protein [Pseudomonas chlororaphis]AZD84753.1 Phage tail fiber protein [Pseudomonas chlororaphis subsp. aureofaciens]